VFVTVVYTPFGFHQNKLVLPPKVCVHAFEVRKLSLVTKDCCVQVHQVRTGNVCHCITGCYNFIKTVWQKIAEGL